MHTKDSQGDAICCCSRARRGTATKECEEEGAEELQETAMHNLATVC